MSALDSILKLLETWPAWKRLTGAPAEIDALRKRVELLEVALRTRAAGRDECPKCHALTWTIQGNRPDDDFGSMGVSYDQWRCSSCHYSREVQAK